MNTTELELIEALQNDYNDINYVKLTEIEQFVYHSKDKDDIPIHVIGHSIIINIEDVPHFKVVTSILTGETYFNIVGTTIWWHFVSMTQLAKMKNYRPMDCCKYDICVKIDELFGLPISLHSLSDFFDHIAHVLVTENRIIAQVDHAVLNLRLLDSHKGIIEELYEFRGMDKGFDLLSGETQTTLAYNQIINKFLDKIRIS